VGRFPRARVRQAARSTARRSPTSRNHAGLARMATRSKRPDGSRPEQEALDLTRYRESHDPDCHDLGPRSSLPHRDGKLKPVNVSGSFLKRPSPYQLSSLKPNPWGKVPQTTRHDSAVPIFRWVRTSMGSKTGRVEMSSAAPADENNVSTIDRACNDYKKESFPSFGHRIAAELPASSPTPQLKSMSDCVYFSSSESQNAARQVSKYYHRAALPPAAANARTRSPRGVYSRKSFWKQPYFCAGGTPSP